MAEISRDQEPGVDLQDNTVSIHIDEDHKKDLETNVGDHTNDRVTEHIDSTSYNRTYSSLDQTYLVDSVLSLENVFCSDEGSCSDATIYDDTSSSLHHTDHNDTRSSQGHSFYDDTQSCFEHTLYDDTRSSFDRAFFHDATASSAASSAILNSDGAAGDSVSVLQWPSRGPATINDIPSCMISETAAELSKEELLTKIRHTFRGIQAQEEYIQRQEAKEQRNTEMIAKLETLIEAKKANVKHLQTECAECEAEISNFEKERDHFKNEIANSSMRHFMGKKLHDDLLEQKDELETERDRIRAKLNERGIPDHVIDDFIKNKRSLAREKQKKQMLQKKLKLYEKQTVGCDVIGETLVCGSEGLAELFAVSTKVITPPNVQEGISGPSNSQYDEAGGDGFILCLEQEFLDALETSEEFSSDESCSEYPCSPGD